MTISSECEKVVKRGLIDFLSKREKFRCDMPPVSNNLNNECVKMIDKACSLR